MRVFFAILFAAITLSLILILNTTLVLPAPLGKLLSPQHGLWQNAENSDEDFSASLADPFLKDKVSVYFDERLVPHIFAAQEMDAYFVQGYLHAKFRLWQMEFQVKAAAGELSALIGDKALAHDREFRRLGMVYAAERANEAFNEDPLLKQACDAYTAGVNSYIKTLKESEYPVEYKLIGYAPEPWSNLKTCLFLKYMSYDLASAEDDFEMTNAKSFFSKTDFDLLYPATQDSLDPIIPASTALPAQTIFPVAPVNADSAYFGNAADSVNVLSAKPDRENGSNNWAVAGSKTQSGAPILCNDPHLGLNFPSLWFEMQLNVPGFNAYGASFPGAPGVIIGFNDSCAFGFTNGGRDVRDYYEITFKDSSRKEYLFSGAYHQTKFRVDTIDVKGAADFIDSVAYVQLGQDWCPVMYDKTFGGKRTGNTKNYAVRWTAHDVSRDLKVFMLLDRAKNYNDYQEAASYLSTPGQNCVFACKNGDIALRTQGSWPAKWKGQGDFIMPGNDSNYLWQGMIPQNEVPFQYNPERAFVSSANQKPVTENYPYYIGRAYPEFRGLTINKRLSAMQNITVKDMQALQTDTYDGFAAMILPGLLTHIDVAQLSNKELSLFTSLEKWNLHDDANSTDAPLFELYYKTFADTVYNDEFANAPLVIRKPYESTLAEALLRDTAYKFLDNINTPAVEDYSFDATAAFKTACKKLADLSDGKPLPWYVFNNVTVRHLAQQAAFSTDKILTGGGPHAINANRAQHGPSWRMIVSLTPQTEAYGVYPGGQSGNPFSRYYDNFVSTWAKMEYYPLWVMTAAEKNSPKIKWVINFTPVKS